jgi:heat shock protein HtpX
LAFQLVFVLYSNKIIARSADWKINEKNPFIHVLEYSLPWGEHSLKDKFSKEKLIELKNKVYEQIISKGGEIDCQTMARIFGESGVTCTPEIFKAKKVDVYNLVKETATKYNFPMPEIVISNTIIPNAAASGPTPSRGVVLITTGLLNQLENNEIISVLGHEFGHLKGRDPLVLYGLTAIQYLLFFYVLYPILAFSIFLFLIYYWLILSLIYFIAKFFEARADLLSAIVVGQPNILAKALEKIGLKRLLYEQIPSFRFQEWLSFDPHPPIYFRVNRLRNIQTPVKIRHPFIQSARDVTRGFLDSLK